MPIERGQIGLAAGDGLGKADGGTGLLRGQVAVGGPVDAVMPDAARDMIETIR